MRQYVLTLTGTAGPAGTLRAQDLARLCTAVQTLVYRLYRDATEELDRGRQPQAVEQLSTLGVSLDAETLRFTVGDEAVLDLDPLAEQVDARAWAIVTGLAAHERPADVPATVADAVVGLVRALSRAAASASITVPGHGSQELISAQLSRDLWERRPQRVLRTVVGELQMTDLRSERCRVADGDEHVVELHGVHNVAQAAQWVGSQVQATGWYTDQLHGRGRLDVNGLVTQATEQDSLPMG